MKKIILFLILLLAFILRFYRLGDYPALNADEASIGYNAYSLLQTGKDEHTNSWPIHFQSFNDYKPGLYFYLVLPFVKIFGLNEWAVRIPGAFLGVATVFVIYFLAIELFKNLSQSLITDHRSLALISAFILAISPWQIHFSRGGWEANVATFFITAGLCLFLKSLKNPSFMLFSFLSFVFSLYTYHASRIVTPLIILGSLVIYSKEISKVKKWFFTSLVFSILVLAPLVKDLTGTAGISRATGVGLFADPGPISRVNEQRGEHSHIEAIPSKVLHNKLVNYSLAFFQNWLAHFNGEFLFLSGDEIQRNKVPEVGQLYLFELPLFLTGFLFLVKNKNLASRLIIWWLIVAPTAAALTFQSPHALRAHNMVIPLTVVSALGMVMIVKWLNGFIKSKNLFLAVYCLLFIVMVWEFVRYQHEYWFHMSKEYPFSSQYGVKELASYIKENANKYPKFVITDRYDQPYILFLFYLKYPPEKFQREHTLTPRDQFGFSTVREFDKYQFISIQPWDRIREEYRGAAIAGTGEEIPDGTNVVKRIYGTNGKLYFEIVAN